MANGYAKYSGIVASGGGGGGGSVNDVTATAPLASSGGSTPDISLTGIVPIANGGTGSSTKNFVDLTTGQTVAGIKSFSNVLNANAGLDRSTAGNLDIGLTAGTNTRIGHTSGALVVFSDIIGFNSPASFTYASGSTFNFGSNILGSVADPVSAQDVATKNYVDNLADNGITQLTGDVTAGPGSGSQASTIANNVVSNVKLAQIAAHSYKGNNTGSTANAADITSTQLTADLNLFTTSLQGLVPLSGGGTTNFLRADGTFNVPPGTGANTALSNLASTALNATLTFASSVTGFVRTFSQVTGNTTAMSILTGNATAGNSGSVNLTSGTASGTRGNIVLNGNNVRLNADGAIIFGSSTVSPGVSLLGTDTTNSPSSPSTSVNIQSGATIDTTSNSGFVHILSGDTSGTTSNSGEIALSTGNVTNGDSGRILIQIGTASGSRGKIYLLDGSQGTAGQVWTSTDTSGAGAWLPAPGGMTGSNNASDTANFAITNWGTITNLQVFSRRVGDSLEVSGSFNNGTGAASPVSLDISTYTIDTAKMFTTSQYVGTWATATGISADFRSGPYQGILFYDGSSSSSLFFAVGGQTNNYVKADGSALAGSGALTQFTFTIPITGWTYNN